MDASSYLFSIFVAACQSMENKKNIALVLSSGGPRGWAYIGAIEELVARGLIAQVTDEEEIRELVNSG